MTGLVKTERPELLCGRTWCVATGCGKVYITINWYEGRVFEVFLTAGKAGGCMSSTTETIGKLISREGAYGLPAEELVKSLKGISCKENMLMGPKSCTDALGIVLEKDIALEAEAQPELPELAEPEEADEPDRD
ncbi:hypothetical protein LCGC14_2560680 [marine sediment metagenome]|uniref:ribonucleoside-diphosphate reductase n=1 Tax=marine sediment metagenome TaxID=412755 RepID=A0A0F9B806_9ZZZZ|nr:TSCPD domain-containing protein [Nitrospirota bacterium]